MSGIMAWFRPNRKGFVLTSEPLRVCRTEPSGRVPPVGVADLLASLRDGRRERAAPFGRCRHRRC